ncbi:hypothetical protein LCGC14_0582240 [marine sediment metagenome]|uniref:Uncharacterized protein n=1 Tax=marine sediment metagenome TaxID=412755 RepID=A0A0F9RL20_9ZZZZ
MRTKTLIQTVVAEDLNGISVSATDIASPFADLTLGGVLATTDAWRGAYVDFSLKTNFTPLVAFKTGATGSTAIATITGLDIHGNEDTETVTMPGASAAVESLKPFSRIDSISMDGAYTNLEVGVKAEIDQFSRWIVFDPYANPFSVFLDLEEVTDGSTLTIELTTDPDIWTPGSNFDVRTFDAVAPFAPTIIISAQGIVTADADQVLPFLAARLRHTAGTAGKWRARFTQAGGGRGR